ncbi:FadR/GntR family transcriptional regulator [Paenibacillus sp. 2TAB26]
MDALIFPLPVRYDGDKVKMNEEKSATLKKLAHESILEQMKAHIESGVWKPGTRLPTLKELAEEFSLSVTAVREALRILESQRIISIEHGRGIFVSNEPGLLGDAGHKLREMGNSSLLQLLEARLVLEPELAYFCAHRATPSQVKQLKELAETMEAQMIGGGDFFTTDLRFHQLIAEGADNPVLAQMLAAVTDLSAAGRRETNKLPNMRGKAASYHNLIAIAMLERQAEQAREIMKAHIVDMMTSVKEHVKIR